VFFFFDKNEGIILFIILPTCVFWKGKGTNTMLKHEKKDCTPPLQDVAERRGDVKKIVCA